jgi:hypothetical protein
VNLKCKLCLSVCLCRLSAMKVQAQDGQGRAGLHRHPPQDQFLHENHRSGTGFCFALGDAT